MSMTYTKVQTNLTHSKISCVQENTYPEDGAAVLTVQTNGRILDFNQSASDLLNCNGSNLAQQHISILRPKLAEVAFLVGENINPNLRFLSRIGYHFEVVTMNGMRFASKLFFVDIENLGECCLRLIIRPISEKFLVS
ncbi:hypothetical protein [Methylotenera sp.]|uniref:hypothetical protein n=1 Tax=Methylotenera sp. TaxID=2051956 RepID=UPI002486FBC5|nr:hypothetical protein [Methylotenera sp.]MDI1361801.1 hypothetical protein [Methylotenera sp.]